MDWSDMLKTVALTVASLYAYDKIKGTGVLPDRNTQRYNSFVPSTNGRALPSSGRVGTNLSPSDRNAVRFA
jgi:hypothetical protein